MLEELAKLDDEDKWLPKVQKTSQDDNEQS